ncbi:hypothetical protein [Pseudonocardia alni]|uniref:hypothetical protein n=1 Tax=Pseudonocardia alni TaxID=33907 RepID=UPI0034045DCB
MDLVLLAFAGILGRLAWTSFREARDGHARWTRGLAATPVTVAELVAMAGSVRDELDARRSARWCRCPAPSSRSTTRPARPR